jgi:hypothetical protein
MKYSIPKLSFTFQNIYVYINSMNSIYIYISNTSSIASNLDNEKVDGGGEVFVSNIENEIYIST